LDDFGLPSPDTFYHFTHYRNNAVDIHVANDNPVHCHLGELLRFMATASSDAGNNLFARSNGGQTSFLILLAPEE